MNSLVKVSIPYPVVLEKIVKELDYIDSFIRMSGETGCMTKELNAQFSKYLDSRQLKERLDWLIMEKRIDRKEKKVGNFYSVFYCSTSN